jgi:hypothetical protein
LPRPHQPGNRAVASGNARRRGRDGTSGRA